MGIALALIFLVAAVVVGLYDQYSVQRTYARLFAERHGGIPPLTEWFFAKDKDAEVEAWRRQHRNMTIVASALAIAGAISALTLR